MTEVTMSSTSEHTLLNENYSSQAISKYHHSKLTDDKGETIYQRLEEWMRLEKPYLNPHLTLSKMASYLRTNTTYLSQVINHFQGTNARDYINSYRIEELEMISESQDLQSLTLIAISELCGFRSYSSFSRAMVKIKGHSPKEILTNAR